MKDFFEILFAIIISTGIIAVFLNYHYDKRLRTHDLRIERYMNLIEELSKFYANEADYSKLSFELNGAFAYGSEGVVKEILNFNEELERLRGSGELLVKEETIKPLIIAIRKDLYLKSDFLQDRKLSFFHNVRKIANNEQKLQEENTLSETQ